MADTYKHILKRKWRCGLFHELPYRYKKGHALEIGVGKFYKCANREYRKLVKKTIQKGDIGQIDILPKRAKNQDWNIS